MQAKLYEPSPGIFGSQWLTCRLERRTAHTLVFGDHLCPEKQNQSSKLDAQKTATDVVRDP